MSMLKRLFAREEPPRDVADTDDLQALSVDDLIALNQSLGRQQDALKERRRVIARVIDEKLGY